MTRAKISKNRKADGRVSTGCAAMGTAQVKPPTKLRTTVSDSQLEPTEAQPIKLHHRMAGITK